MCGKSERGLGGNVWCTEIGITYKVPSNHLRQSVRQINQRRSGYGLHMRVTDTIKFDTSIGVRALAAARHSTSRLRSRNSPNQVLVKLEEFQNY
ncbi:unnamed protein product [Arctia plantaginis]|uniref:Uncharacterized protein n=1 Tax=Arctia plantaginis TaxID=874455 RepID=A0A8S1AVC4_ARCPL|nr:unnamed protein product [Arctia plantaginis]